MRDALEGLPPDLERARLALSRGAGLYGRSLELHAEVGSTNDDARAAAERGAPRGHVVLADAQRTGRGARGSAWSSPAGTDLYLSVVERLDLGPRTLGVLTLAVGLGVRDACARLLSDRGAEVRVKWPNDVRIGDRKCAGILVESSSVGERLGAIVVGIGLDVNRTDWPAELRDVATSLCEAAGVPLDRGEALVTLLASVEARVEELVRRGPDAIVAALRPHLAFVGRAVRVDGLEGMLEGLDDDGALLLRTRDALLRLRSGTLRERE